jgi:hypothetical protein
MAALYAHPLAIVLCSVASMGLGVLWYTRLFHRANQRFMYDNPDGVRSVPPAGVAKAFVAYVAVAIFTSWAFLVALELLRAGSTVMTARPATLADEGAFVVLLWAGFFVPAATNKLVWQFKPWQVAVIDGGYELVRVCVMWGIARLFA